MPGLQWMEGGKISRLHSVDGTRGYEGKKKEKKRETKGLLNPPSPLLSPSPLSGCACGFDFSCTEQILSSVRGPTELLVCAWHFVRTASYAAKGGCDRRTEVAADVIFGATPT